MHSFIHSCQLIVNACEGRKRPTLLLKNKNPTGCGRPGSKKQKKKQKKQQNHGVTRFHVVQEHSLNKPTGPNIYGCVFLHPSNCVIAALGLSQGYVKTEPSSPIRQAGTLAPIWTRLNTTLWQVLVMFPGLRVPLG